MNLLVGYDNNVKFCNTHPDLILKEKNLRISGIKQSKVLSMSVLSEIANTVPISILKNGASSERDGNSLAWLKIDCITIVP